MTVGGPAGVCSRLLKAVYERGKSCDDEDVKKFMLWRFVKFWLAGGFVGMATVTAFFLASNLFSTDGIFTGQEFVVALLTPAFVAVAVAKVTRLGICSFVVVAYLTFLVPGLGPMFGASGSEPLYIWPALGLAGGLVWSIPFAIFRLARR